MPGKAYDVMKAFWAMQDSRDYTQLNDFFTEDSELHDPIYGAFVGKPAIIAFLAKATKEMGEQGFRFDLVELQGEAEVAWGRWEGHSPKGVTQGCGIYKVRDGKILYYRDYYNY
jgi:limonene-1,2-epoxide hydrolase